MAGKAAQVDVADFNKFIDDAGAWIKQAGRDIDNFFKGIFGPKAQYESAKYQDLLRAQKQISPEQQQQLMEYMKAKMAGNAAQVVAEDFNKFIDDAGAWIKQAGRDIDNFFKNIFGPKAQYESAKYQDLMRAQKQISPEQQQQLMEYMKAKMAGQAAQAEDFNKFIDDAGAWIKQAGRDIDNFFKNIFGPKAQYESAKYQDLMRAQKQISPEQQQQLMAYM